jgi:hypothetical protein
MSHTVTERCDIPNAPFYVMCNDKFMSGWGEAKNARNTIILPCQSYEQAEIVERNAQDRPEQKNVRIVSNKPRFRPGVVYSLLTDDGSCYWFRTDRPFRHHGGAR